MQEINPTYQPFFSAADGLDENGRRWRLILGQTEARGQRLNRPNRAKATAKGDEQQTQTGLSEQDQAMDEALEALYGDSTGGDLSDSNPDIARWLGDIRTYFPAEVVQVMQQDALNKLNLRRLLSQPEFLEAIEPDVQLVANLLSLRRVMPSKTKETAKEVVRKVVEQLVGAATLSAGAGDFWQLEPGHPHPPSAPQGDQLGAHGAGQFETLPGGFADGGAGDVGGIRP